MNDSDHLWNVVKILPTDYSEYGGQIKRSEEVEGYYPDCSSDCKYFIQLYDKKTATYFSDWGICSNFKSPRKGLLTWKYQAGLGCHVNN
jgi:hypothetical protein